MTRSEFQEMIGEICRDWRFKRLLREIVLEVIISQKEQEDLGRVRAIMANCEAHDIHLYLDENGVLKARNAKFLTPEIKSTIIAFRPEIMRHLEKYQALERSLNQPTNGQRVTK